MAKEIERKYLVKGQDWKQLASGTVYRQGYIATTGTQTVRIRVIDQQGYLTIKGANQGIIRSEFEYPIPVNDAEEILETLCDRPLIEKIRYKIPQDNLIWEVDEFLGDNAGLVIAEIELTDPQQKISLPPWIDRQVTDPKYFNSNLVKHPYKDW